MALRIEQHYLDEMIAHAREEAPNECCGVLLGSDGRVRRFIRCTNAEHSPFRYSVAPRELLDIDRQARENDWDVFVIYHSHLRSPAYPSPTDVRLAGYPEATYVLVSLADEQNPDVRAYQILDGAITEEAVEALAGEV